MMLLCYHWPWSVVMSTPSSRDEEKLHARSASPSLKRTILLVALFVFISFYLLCGFSASVELGLYRVSSWHLTTSGIVPASYGSLGGLGTIFIIAATMLLVLPMLGIGLLTVVFGQKQLPVEQRLFWITLVIELMIMLVISYPITDAVIEYILYS
jgi:hypothetical protein